MIVNKVSPSKRKKKLAENNRPNTFIRWNSTRNYYEGVIEVYNSATGEKFEFTAGQIEWEETHSNLMDAFTKHAHA